jgi:hypothetical protein
MGLRGWILWVAGHLVPRRTSNICRSGWLERFRDAHVAGLWNIDAPGLGSYVERCCFPPRFALTLALDNIWAASARAVLTASRLTKARDCSQTLFSLSLQASRVRYARWSRLPRLMSARAFFRLCSSSVTSQWASRRAAARV